MAKNVKNFNGTLGSGGSGTVVTYEFFEVPTQTIAFTLNPSEFFVVNFYYRGIFVPPGQIGQLPEIKLVKIGNLVTLYIPSFYGNLNIGNNQSVMSLVTPGVIPTRFLPKYNVSMPVNARNGGGLISGGQDFADLVITNDGFVNLISRTFLWNGSVGIEYDISISWINEF